MKSLELIQESEFVWRIPKSGKMRVDGVIYASEDLVQAMDAKVFQQVANVASLPGIVGASMAMPDAHSGYGFPIGGVAAFDARNGVVSAGGVGFDIACGVRCLTTGLNAEEVLAAQKELADELWRAIPAGLGRGGRVRLKGPEMDAMLTGGARWAVKVGYGEQSDLEYTEEGGCMAGADPEAVSDRAKERQRDQSGTLGSGNHYLEVQEVARVLDPEAADAYGLAKGDVVLSIHCGSRGLGHQIGTDFLKRMNKEAPAHGNGIRLPDRELACAPVLSPLGQEYLGAMRAGINCALANRQVLTHLAREAFAGILSQARLRLLYDVSHNTCKLEEHVVEGRKRLVFVHRKGATRSLGPGHPDLPVVYRAVGQPVLVGGSMGTSSYILAGQAGAMEKSFGSANHGAGRAFSRSQAKKRWRGHEVLASLEERGILIRAADLRGVAEEAPGAYKDVEAVAGVVQALDLAKPVVQLRPLICVKG